MLPDIRFKLLKLFLVHLAVLALFFVEESAQDLFQCVQLFDRMLSHFEIDLPLGLLELVEGEVVEV